MEQLQVKLSYVPSLCSQCSPVHRAAGQNSATLPAGAKMLILSKLDGIIQIEMKPSLAQNEVERDYRREKDQDPGYKSLVTPNVWLASNTNTAALCQSL